MLAGQIIAGFVLALLMILIHAVGVVLVTKLLKLEDSTLRAHRLDFGAFGLLTTMALSLFFLHAFEMACSPCYF